MVFLQGFPIVTGCHKKTDAPGCWFTLRLLPLMAVLAAILALPAGLRAADDMPRPSTLQAESTPNEDGTRITLRWPATAAELRLAEEDSTLTSGPQAERKKTDFGYEYVFYVSRNPDWRWFECKRVHPAAGFVMDTGIAGHYPYHFSNGKQHFTILAPTSAMKVRINGELVDYTEVMPWLAREQQFADWIDGALGKLNNCQNLLVRIDRTVEDQQDLLRKYENAEPEWRESLAEAKKAYIEQFDAPAADTDFDTLQLVQKLKDRQESISEKVDAGEDADEELETVQEKLHALTPARKLAQWLKEATQKKQQMQSQIASYRDVFFAAAAYYAYYSKLIHGECRQTLARYAGADAENMDADAISNLLPDLKRRLAEARQDVQSGSPGPEEYAEYDRLTYLTFLADYCLKREKRRPDWRSIRSEMLAELSRSLDEADLPKAEDENESDDSEEVDTEALLQRLDELANAREALEREPGKKPADEWIAADEAFTQAGQKWRSAFRADLVDSYETGAFKEQKGNPVRREVVRLRTVVSSVRERLDDVKIRHARRRYHFRLAVAQTGGEPADGSGPVAAGAARPNFFDTSKLTNIIFATIFAVTVVGMLLYVRRNPDVFIRKIPGLDAVDEAIGRATEMGKPVLFVHGLSEISTIAVIASLNVLGKIARQVAVYDTDLLVANERPIVYSVSYEVVQEGYMEAGRPDAFNPDNVMMVATEQFPYVAAVAGIMNRREPAANLFMGKFYAESLILAEAGALTGAIQIAATDAFTQLPFFITTCDYTLMGEELYAASAYLSRDPKLLSTIKAQDVGKSILLTVLPVGTIMASTGLNWVRVIFTAYAKS